MTNEKKSLVEEALLQMKNLENVVTENAKGILASTMKEEIEELVKESLEETEEQLTPDESSEMEQDTDISMSDMGDEDSMEMSTMTMDDESGETDFEEMGMEDDEIEPLDMTQASDDELLKVILGMGDDDRLIVQKSGDEVDVDKLTQTDSMSFPMGGEDEEMSEPEFSDEEEEIVYEIEISDDEDEKVNESMTIKPKGVGMGNETVTESSLSRIYSHVQKYDCAIITAFRNKLINCSMGDESGKELNIFQNKSRNKNLKSALMMLGYGVTSVKGSYIENYMEDNQIEVTEDSYFVTNRNNDSRFEKTIISLGKMFCQDSVAIIKKGGENNYLVGTNYSDFPGFNNIEQLGKIKMGHEDEFMTRVGNRPFVMESFDDSQINTKRLIIKYGKPILEMIKIL